MALPLNKFKSPSPQDAVHQMWLKLARWFWGKRFIISSKYFCYLVIISPLKRVGHFI